MNHGNDKFPAAAKNEFDHEKIALRPQAGPITEPAVSRGGGRQAPEHYRSFGNGVRARLDATQRVGPNAGDWGPAGRVTELPAQQRSAGEGAGLADPMSQVPRPAVTARDRNNDADETISAAENGFFANETASTPQQIVAAAKAEIAASLIALDTRAHQYVRKSEIMQVRFDQASGSRAQQWAAALAPYAPKPNSFSLMRAASSWDLKKQLWVLLPGAELALSGTLDVDTEGPIRRLKATLDDLKALWEIDRRALLEAGQSTKKVHSKRNDLKKLPADWRAMVLDRASSSDTYRNVIALLALTGIRPIELEHGVTITTDDGKALIRVNKGAKVSDFAGQEWREFRVARQVLPVDIRDRLWDGADEVEVRIVSTGALREFLKEISRELGFAVTASAYAFRHALAQDLRENGWEAHEIGSVLGHAVATTAAQYGNKIRPGKRRPPAVGLQKSDIKIPKPIKPLAVFDRRYIARKPLKRKVER